VARRIRREGAFVAWMFLMIFTVTLAFVMIALAMTGSSFEESILMSVAALSTTGPLVGAVSQNADSFKLLSPAAQFILCIAMILGRLEALGAVYPLHCHDPRQARGACGVNRPQIAKYLLNNGILTLLLSSTPI